MTAHRYAELQVTSHFSFLRGASSAEELFATAALMGIEALGIVDRNSLAGIVRAWEAAKATGIKLLIGCRLDLACGASILLYPTDRPAYSRLCRLLTLGKGRAGKGKCHIEWSDLPHYAEGQIAILVPDEADETCAMRRGACVRSSGTAPISRSPCGAVPTTRCASMSCPALRRAWACRASSPTTSCFTSLDGAFSKTW